MDSHKLLDKLYCIGMGLLGLMVLVSMTCKSVDASTNAHIEANEGFPSKYATSGWVAADMSVNEYGVVTKDASYSMRLYKTMGLIPVAYCASGGSRIGTYYVFFVNPQTGYLMVDRTGLASHSMVFDNAGLEVFDKTGYITNVTDISSQQNLYRKAIQVAQAELAKYNAMWKN